MLEACHRGFQDIVEILIRGGADLKYIPSAEQSNSSPFVTAPAQTALAESARCGFHGIVQVGTEFKTLPCRLKIDDILDYVDSFS